MNRQNRRKKHKPEMKKAAEQKCSAAFLVRQKVRKICRDFIENFLLSLLQYLCIAKRVAGHALSVHREACCRACMEQ